MRPDIVQTYPFIDKWRAKGYQYYVVPKDMLTDGAALGINLDETFLYVVLRDRTKLSFKNNWIDDSGNGSIIYTREDAANYIGWSKRKTVDVFARLVEAGLLLEKEQPMKNSVLKKPKRLYLRKWVPPSPFHSVEELKNGGFPLFTRANILGESDPYYIIPKVFFEDEALHGLPLRSIMLYAIALDKIHLSIQYGRVDEDGKVWCSLDNEAVRQELGCGKNSLLSAYKELENLGLILRKMPKDMSGYRLYLRDYLPSEGAKIVASQDLHVESGGEVQNLHQSSLDSASGEFDSCTREISNLHAENPNAASADDLNLHASQSLTHPDVNQLFSVSLGGTPPEAAKKEKVPLDFATCYEALQDRFDYPLFCSLIAQHEEGESRQETMYRLLDASIEQMAKDMSFPGKYIRIGQEVLKKGDVLLCYRDLDLYTLYALLRAICERMETITNLDAYLHRALVRAVETHGAAAFYIRRELERELEQ